MRMQDPIAKLLGAGLVLGVLLGLATPTKMLAPPDPPWRGKGAALAEQQEQQRDSYPATFSGETYNPAPWPGERGEYIPPKVTHAKVYAGADWRLDDADFPPEPAQRSRDDYQEREPPAIDEQDDRYSDDVPATDDESQGQPPVQVELPPASY